MDHFDLRIVTYNVHRCQGMDRRTRPARVAEVLRAIGADVLALQEVIGSGPRGNGHAEELGAALGMGWAMAPTRRRRGHLLGNVIMSRLPIRHHTSINLSWRNYSFRNCQRADLLVDGERVLHVYNVHLGTGFAERRYQAEKLETFITDRHIRGPKIVVGDFNEWTPGEATSMMLRNLRSIDLMPFLKRRRTYPGILPLVHLDHVYYEGRVELRNVELPRTRKSLLASDHLPLVADLRVRF